MRIIAGDFRGKRLFTPSGNKVRPTSDKVKESIFNIIAPYVVEAVVIDGFSGSGNLGLEALSRGADKVYFIDSSMQSIALIQKNIAFCNMSAKSEVIFGRFEKIAGHITEKAGLILLDPPYGKGDLETALQVVCDRQLLTDDGVVVAEHPKEQQMPETFCPKQDFGQELVKSKERRYGNICVSLYEKAIISGNL